MNTPYQILERLLPYLKVAAQYAQKIQSSIVGITDKNSDNIFESALSEADISVQTFVEVALLGLFPHLGFYGEEEAQSHNTKYFPFTRIFPGMGYLVLLDPIDGTRWYLDGHSNYQLVFSIVSNEAYEAVIILLPSENLFFYALRDQGAWSGNFNDDLNKCQPLDVSKYSNLGLPILLNLGMEYLKPELDDKYKVLVIKDDYSRQIQIPNTNGILKGEVRGVILKAAKLIDGAAIAFIAKEAGAIVSGLDGSSIPPIYTANNYVLKGLLMAIEPETHQELMKVISRTSGKLIV